MVDYTIPGILLEWSKEQIDNSGKMYFDAIEFITNDSRIEIKFGKCQGIVCC
jgi:hypothetical protein